MCKQQTIKMTHFYISYLILCRKNIGIRCFGVKGQQLVISRYVALQVDETLSRLETEYELQDKITAAYQKLTRDTSVSKSVRRSREQCYRKAHGKVSCIFESLWWLPITSALCVLSFILACICCFIICHFLFWVNRSRSLMMLICSILNIVLVFCL